MIRVEFDHTVKVRNFSQFIDEYWKAIEVDRGSNPDHKDPRVMVSVWGDLNRVRIEFEMESLPQNWIDNGYPSYIEWVQNIEHYQVFLSLTEKTEVRWLNDIEISC